MRNRDPFEDFTNLKFNFDESEEEKQSKKKLKTKKKIIGYVILAIDISFICFMVFFVMPFWKNLIHDIEWVPYFYNVFIILGIWFVGPLQIIVVLTAISMRLIINKRIKK